MYVQAHDYNALFLIVVHPEHNLGVIKQCSVSLAGTSFVHQFSHSADCTHTNFPSRGSRRTHRIQDVIELADKQRKKVEGKFVVDPDDSEVDEFVYIQCLLETGIAKCMPPYDSIDDISTTTRSAPSTVELRRLPGIAAHDILKKFLRKWSRIVDTVLARTFTGGEKMTDLYALLEELKTCRGRMDTERALKVRHPAKRGQKAVDEAATLRQIRVDPAFHTELALVCIDEVLSFLADDATSKLWQAKGIYLIKSSFEMT
ncbi:hypothetical protein BGW80DRAFT_1251407 [Lactifluus volemus]|nr:hypothetical protein BGW80DRAFT_1251407 [Lactifluus volemus]